MDLCIELQPIPFLNCDLAFCSSDFEPGENQWLKRYSVCEAQKPSYSAASNLKLTLSRAFKCARSAKRLSVRGFPLVHEGIDRFLKETDSKVRIAIRAGLYRVLETAGQYHGYSSFLFRFL